MKESIYTYLDSKKIYFASIKDKYLLIEKTTTNEKKSISLKERNTTIINAENGLLLFPKK